MSDKKFCYRCGAPMQASDAFCMQCGAKVLKKRHTFCYHCGAQLNEGDAFCMKCGTPVKKQAVPPTPPVPPKPKSPGKQPPAGKPAKRKGKAGKIVLRVIAAVLVVVLLAGVWKGGRFVWSLFEKDGTVELQAGQSVQPGQTVSYAETSGKTAPGVDNAKKKIASTLGIDTDELGECQNTQAMGDSFYNFEQMYDGIPVYGRNTILATESSGDAVGVFGNYMALENVDTTPELSDEEARKTLRKKLGDCVVLSAELTIYTLQDSKPELAWCYRVLSEDFSGEYVISAQNGKVLSTNSNQRTLVEKGTGVDNREIERKFNTSFYGNGYYSLEDTVHGFTIYDSNGSSHTRRYYVYGAKGNFYIEVINGEVLVYREDGTRVDNEEAGDVLNLDRCEVYLAGHQLSPKLNVGKTWTDSDAVSLMHALEVCYNFFDEYYGAKGFNKQGGSVVAIYNDDLYGDPVNAYSASDLDADGVAILAFGRYNSISTDLVGHEYMHSVESCASGMKYEDESGAIMEAYSDIFGELIEDYDLDGELNGDCDWVNVDRTMMDPGLSGYPTIYNGLFWGNTEEEADHGHVHRNSTVISHIAYNMVRTDNFISEPLSMEKMMDQFYYTLHVLPEACTMKEFAENMMFFAELDHEAGVLTESELLTVHLALVRAGLLELDFSKFPEFDFIRVVAHEMAMFVPQILIDEIGISRAELEEAYYQELTVFWIQLNDPEVQAAFKALYDYVVHGTPLEFE